MVRAVLPPILQIGNLKLREPKAELQYTRGWWLGMSTGHV